jgi:competence protein ComEA
MMRILSWFERNQALAIGVPLIILLAGFVLSQLVEREPDGIEFAYASSLAEGAPIRVQVEGSVVNAGVYELHEGDRLIDAIAAAGGPSADAAVDQLNLARRVRDEERVTVPRASTAQSALGVNAVSGKININTATAQQLDSLPGIGEAYSRRIVDSRAVDGPYKTTDELVGRRVIPAATFAQIRDLITVQ